MRTDNIISITIDVEWAHQEVLSDVVNLLNERGITATFFCTHEDIKVSGHERALHPNFRWEGNIMKDLRLNSEVDLNKWSQTEIHQHVLKTTYSFCPEAVGVRTHSLYYDSGLIPIYSEYGIKYDSSYLTPLVSGLKPFWKECNVIEFPIYYMDHWDLLTQTTGFNLKTLNLNTPGLKVFAFHPNIIFTNVSNEEEYLATKSFYHDPKELLKVRKKKQGARSLFIDLLDLIKKENLLCFPLEKMNDQIREEM